MASSMPISSPPRTRFPRRRALLQLAASACLATCCFATCCLAGASAYAQTLARPGWAGSGLTPNPWWRHAVIYAIDPHDFQDSNGDGTGDLPGLARRLDYLQSLGIDALLLRQLAPADSAIEKVAIDPALGTIDDFDNLVIQASRHNMRILIELRQTDPTADVSGIARFWLSRGVAGFRLVAANTTDTSIAMHQLRSLIRGYVGERILIGDPSASIAPPVRGHSPAAKEPPQLLVDPFLSTVPTLDAAAFRTALEKNDSLLSSGSGLPLAITDAISDTPDATPSAVRFSHDHEQDAQSIGKLIATLLLTTRAASMLQYGQEIALAPTPTAHPLMPWGKPDAPANAKTSPPAIAANTPQQPPANNVATQDADPDSLLNWYRHLSVLQHSNMKLRSGTTLVLNHDADHVVAWVRKPQVVSLNTPALVFVCNLSASPVKLSLRPDMQRLHLKGSFLRSTLRSDNAMGALNLDAITLQPYGIYIGELRY